MNYITKNTIPTNGKKFLANIIIYNVDCCLDAFSIILLSVNNAKFSNIDGNIYIIPSGPNPNNSNKKYIIYNPK